jgi:Na+-transporting NADH:ubiquinone oxidoreductase subunit F
MLELFIYSVLGLSLLGGAFAVALLIADRYLADYGECKLVVNGEDTRVVQGGGSVLDALYEHEIFIPSGCGGQGTCGYCKVIVESGGGPVLPTEAPFLTPQEMRDNTRLACQVKIRGDIEVRVKEEYLHVQQFRATVASARMLTHDTREIRLRLEEPESLDFRAGQYVQVLVPDQLVYRAYSISSRPSLAGEIELIVRLVPGGLASTWLHRVEPGEEVVFTGPYGDFELTDEPHAHVVCIGGGCGMAPVKSIVEHILESHPERRCSLFFGARTARDALCFEEFRRAAEQRESFDLHYALSEPGADDNWDGETGFIHTLVEEHLPAEADCQVFVCGPEAMIEAVTEVLKFKRIPDSRVYFDTF